MHQPRTKKTTDRTRRGARRTAGGCPNQIVSDPRPPVSRRARASAGRQTWGRVSDASAVSHLFGILHVLKTGYSVFYRRNIVVRPTDGMILVCVHHVRGDTSSNDPGGVVFASGHLPRETSRRARARPRRRETCASRGRLPGPIVGLGYALGVSAPARASRDKKLNIARRQKESEPCRR